MYASWNEMIFCDCALLFWALAFQLSLPQQSNMIRMQLIKKEWNCLNLYSAFFSQLIESKKNGARVQLFHEHFKASHSKWKKRTSWQCLHTVYVQSPKSNGLDPELNHIQEYFLEFSVCQMTNESIPFE